TYRVRSAATSWRSRRLAAATFVPVENGQYEPTPSDTSPPCLSFLTSSFDSPIDGFLSPRGAMSRHSHARDAGTTCIMPMTPYDGFSRVHAGMRTPNVRTSTAWGSLTTSLIMRRGMTTRGLGQRLPFESSECSHGRIVAPGVPWIEKNTSGA